LIKLNERAFAGVARNVGIRATRAPYCLMIDSDCVAESDLIERAMARHREDNYAAVGGSLANGTPRSISGTIGYLIEFKEFMPSAPMRLVQSVPTANVTYRRETLERYGCFDEVMWLAEDILLHWKMFQAGERILFDPSIKVQHLNKTGWRQVLYYQIDLGRFSAIARKRGGLAGGILLNFPPLILLMPFARLLRAFTWFAKHDGKVLLRFLLIWPAYLLAGSFWSFGFLAECRKKSSTPVQFTIAKLINESPAMVSASDGAVQFTIAKLINEKGIGAFAREVTAIQCANSTSGQDKK